MKTAQNKWRVDFEGTYWFALAEMHENGLSVSYKVYESCVEPIDTNPPVNNTGWTPLVIQEDQEDYLLFEGFVKWDGCSNWSSDGMHFCSQQQLHRVGDAMAILWEDAASAMFPKWDGGSGGEDATDIKPKEQSTVTWA